MKTLYIILLTHLILFLFNDIFAQIRIDGTITDSDLDPINNALVEIIDQDDTINNYSSTTDASGYFSISNIFTDLAERQNIVPSDFIVLRNYPNPFNPSTIIYYELPNSENIEIKIYDILGREVRTLFNEFHKAGTYTLNWNGRNDWNSSVAAGIYFCRLKTKDQFKVHKMVLLDGGSKFVSASSLKLKNPTKQNISKQNSNFNFMVKVSGNSILESDFNYLTCSTDTTLNLIVPKILQTATIGPEGGKLENEDLSLIVPEGAFTEIASLKLGIELNIEDYSETRLTKVFRIDGLPNYYNKPLGLRIKYEIETHDSVSLAVGTESIDLTTDYKVTNFNFINVEDSSGFLIGKLPIPDGSNSRGYNKLNDKLYYNKLGWKTFMGLTKPGIEQTDPFIIYYESNELFSTVLELSNNFEEIYSWFNALLGLKADDVGLECDTVKVTFHNFGSYKDLMRPNRYACCNREFDYIFHRYVNDNYFITLDLNKINSSNMQLIKNDQAHYLYMLYPSFYLNGYNNSGQHVQLYQIPTQFWLHHAIASWSEEHFSQKTDFIPLDFNLHYKAAFNGIQAVINSSNSRVESHGIGMSALIKHLTEKYGNGIIAMIFEGLKSNSNALEVILEVLEQKYSVPEYIWWPNFFKEFIQSNIYSVPGEEFLKNITVTINFNDGDTLKNVDETYNDLSAKLFKIKINSEEIKTKTLNFKIDSNAINIDYIKTLVFGLSNNNLTFLADGTDFNVSNFQSYDALIACVVNSGNEAPYTGNSNIDLDIRVSNDLAFRHCDINFAVVEMHDTLEGVWSPGWYTDGVFKDNVFTGTINKERQGGNAIGSIRVEVDDNQNIIFLDVMAYHSDQYGSSQWGFTAQGVPPTENEPYLLVYSHSGYSVCNYVKSIYAKYTYPNGDETEIRNFKCEDESLLHIKFHNWD